MLRLIAITLVFGALCACVSTPDAPDTSSPPNERDAALDASISEDVARVEASARCEHPLGCLAFRSPGDFLLPGETADAGSDASDGASLADVIAVDVAPDVAEPDAADERDVASDVTWVCFPGEVSCDSARALRTCTPDGAGYVVTACDERTTCRYAACVPWVCEPGTATCSDDSNRRVCRYDGTGWDSDPCPTAPHSTPYCADGVCGSTCLAGWQDCDGVASNGCESAMASDPRNCGRCGNSCRSGEACEGGVCVTETPPIVCGARQALRDGRCVSIPAACCIADSECDDGDPTTDDSCGMMSGSCEFRRSSCDATHSCDDGDPLTDDVCAGGLCSYRNRIPQCSTTADCMFFGVGSACATYVCVDHMCERAFPEPSCAFRSDMPCGYRAQFVGGPGCWTCVPVPTFEGCCNPAEPFVDCNDHDPTTDDSCGFYSHACEHRVRTACAISP